MSKDIAIKPNEIRSFIAIELPTEVREQIDILRDKLKNNVHVPGSWVKTENIHLTLKFLGNVPENRISKMGDILIDISRNTASFYIELDALGAFPTIRHPRILWIGLSGDIPELLSLQKNIDKTLNDIGFPLENRPFSPHLTLCRIKEDLSPVLCNSLNNAFSTISVENKIRFQVNEFILFKSQLTPSGSIYSRLFTAELRKK
jgi:RNA 2',3'-cyclic 3'-phosphodiesterase